MVDSVAYTFSAPVSLSSKAITIEASSAKASGPALLSSAAPEDLEPLAGMAFLNGIGVRLAPVAAPAGSPRPAAAAPAPSPR